MAFFIFLYTAYLLEKVVADGFNSDLNLTSARFTVSNFLCTNHTRTMLLLTKLLLLWLKLMYVEMHFTWNPFVFKVWGIGKNLLEEILEQDNITFITFPI